MKLVSVLSPPCPPTFFFGHGTQHVGSSFPDQVPNPHALHWKCSVSTAGLPGKSHVPIFLMSKLSPRTINGLSHHIQEEPRSNKGLNPPLRAQVGLAVCRLSLHLSIITVFPGEAVVFGDHLFLPLGKGDGISWPRVPPTHLDSVPAEARRVSGCGPAEAVSGMKQDLRVLGDLQVLMRDLDQPRSGEGGLAATGSGG